MTVRKTGQWSKVKDLTAQLKPIMNKAKKTCLMRWGIKAEGLAKSHMSAQDLGWRPLKPKTLEVKIRGGFSENILIMTSSYFQAITSYVQGDTAFAGVKKGTKNTQGDDLTKIAAVHEYGNDNMPARPLWTPVFKETMLWTTKENNPVDILMKDLNSKFGK